MQYLELPPASDFYPIERFDCGRQPNAGVEEIKLSTLRRLLAGDELRELFAVFAEPGNAEIEADHFLFRY